MRFMIWAAALLIYHPVLRFSRGVFEVLAITGGDLLWAGGLRPARLRRKNRHYCSAAENPSIAAQKPAGKRRGGNDASIVRPRQRRAWHYSNSLGASGTLICHRLLGMHNRTCRRR